MHIYAETEDECDEEDGEPSVERGSNLGSHGRVSTHQASEHRTSACIIPAECQAFNSFSSSPSPAYSIDRIMHEMK